jgi:hypothetical protein
MPTSCSAVVARWKRGRTGQRIQHEQHSRRNSEACAGHSPSHSAATNKRSGRSESSLNLTSRLSNVNGAPRLDRPTIVHLAGVQIERCSAGQLNALSAEAIRQSVTVIVERRIGQMASHRRRSYVDKVNAPLAFPPQNTATSLLRS